MTRLLLTTDTVGGVWNYATDLAGALIDHGIEPVLVALGPKPRLTQRGEVPAGVELIETDLPLDWLAATPREVVEAGEALARLADRARVDVVQVNAPALAAKSPFQQPVIAVAHSCVCTWWQAVRGGTIDPDLAWRAALTGEGLRAADWAIAPSAAFGAALQCCYGLAEPPLVVRNGRRHSEPSAHAPHDFAFTAGRLWDEAKNIGVLEKAAASLSMPLRAAGPTTGPNGSAVTLRHVDALGSLSESAVSGWLSMRPIYVTSALYEPFGLAVLEAAQAGCALVLSDIPTFRELWDGAASFVYPHDPRGFARAIEDIAGDPALRAHLGQAAQERSARYTVERMAAEMAALYRELTDNAPAELVPA